VVELRNLRRLAEASEGVELRPGPPRVLPCQDSTVSPEYFWSLRSSRQVVLLAGAAFSNLEPRLQSDQPDVIVLATETFSASLWRLKNSLSEPLSAIPSLLLTSETGASLRRQAGLMHIGSVLPLDIDTEQLIAAIGAAAAGLTVALEHSTDDARIGLAGADDPFLESPEPEHLTARESTVLRLMALGRANKEIAAELHISEHTAKFHVSSVLAKLGAASRTEAVTIGIMRGIVAI
jgi:DNA-binding NarL/FixJ family response regulator